MSEELYIQTVHEPIGAQDGVLVDLTNYTEWSDDSDLLPWYEAGEVYCMARRGANAMRHDTFVRDGYVTPEMVYPSGGFATTLGEQRTGCPAPVLVAIGGRS